MGNMEKKEKGILIVIEGVDGSGKQTQSEKLYQTLLAQGEKVRKVQFPDYDSESSALVKMYLRGDFGKDPDDVSAYVASSFFAVDRYASFNLGWKDFYNSGGIVIADRYTTANMVHQASKIRDRNERVKFLDWLYDLEFNIYKIPVPDLIFFLDVPPDVSKELTKARKNKITGEEQKDIHESDEKHLLMSYSNAHFVADRYGWEKVMCAVHGKMRPVEDIFEEVYLKVMLKMSLMR
jgi:dTMP kinase